MTGIKKYVVVVAGGSGLRMGAEIPKQFISVAGKPILMHTLERFYNYDQKINLILVLPESHKSFWKDLCMQHNFNIKHNLVSGGKERFYSVKNALGTINGDGLVAIHDGVRPLVSIHTIGRCFTAALEKKAVIPTLPLSESLRKLDKAGSTAMDRSLYCNVQTPQVFDLALLKKAYLQEYSTQFTDDASVVEYLGQQITLVEGNEENIKITRPMDLKIAALLLQAKD